jgi:hypothetical protein
MQSELSTMPAGELADVLDLVIWNMGGEDSPPVAEWIAELRARPDADTPAVRRAVAVCMEYLSPPGSPWEAIAASRTA